ncbi:MAG: dihydropteroate synthase [Candidatus Pelagibacter sp.]
MLKYYTRACNFYYGDHSTLMVNKRLSLPLNGNHKISFDTIELITRKKKKKIHISKLNLLSKVLKKKVQSDIKNITKKKNFSKLKFESSPLIMGVVNLTPDSFSDGGKYNNYKEALKRVKNFIEKGSSIIDIGGESTRPGSNDVNEKTEWKRIKDVLKRIKKLKNIISIDTRKSTIMEKSLEYGAHIINDVSGLKHDPNTLKILRNKKIPFVIHHMQGNPKTMQIKPSYKNVILDIYDFFEKKILELKANGINHKNIILDPGIGFGKRLKHNITLLRNISIFHSLGFPVMLGTSRKRFIKDISGINDSKERLGGTISSSLCAMMQGIQILRVHDVNEVNQSIKVFKSLKF